MAKPPARDKQNTVKSKAGLTAQAIPEQKLGDTPVAPWKMPAPDEKRAAEPLRKALTDALSAVDSQAKADEVVDTLEAALGTKPAEEVAKEQAKTTAGAAAQRVRQTAAATPEAARPATVLAETARAIQATQGRDREALSQAVQEVFSPEQQGAPGIYQRRRGLLRKALFKRLQPLDALDAALFIDLNHLPHTRFANGIFYFTTVIFSGGLAWYALMGASMLRRRRWDWSMVRASAVPLAVATSAVEYPIKAFFQRRRPFVTLVRAIVVGKKPGTFSFPSGHSASAFAGATLLRQHFPRQTGLWYAIAGLVAFSRIYLGDHYPADVISGSLLGHSIARLLSGWLGQRSP